MAASDWRLEGEWIKNCNCAFGCPCDFNALPTHGSCKGLVGMRITKGHFEGTKLDGLVFAATVDFPGALHEGNGQMQPIIDERAAPEQRQALFNIMSGKNSAEGTLFVPIEFSFDKSGRVARLVAKGALETEVEPIKNPVTGAAHRIQVVMPEGFEHRSAEVASANIHSTGAIKFDTKGTHSSLANVVQTPQGVA
jgi:hypothetical protein